MENKRAVNFDGNERKGKEQKFRKEKIK